MSSKASLVATLCGTALLSDGHTLSLRQAKSEEQLRVESNNSGQNAADFPPKCPQTLDPRQEVTPQSEDCLFFVIYTPANISTAADAPKLPVFFW